MLARSVLLEGESVDRFCELLASLHADFQPSSGIESSLVESMAVARWRQLRVWAIEKSGIDFEMERQGHESDGDPATHAAIAFRTLSEKSRLLDLLNRYEAQCSREYHRSLKALMDLSKRSHRDYDPYVD